MASKKAELNPEQIAYQKKVNEKIPKSKLLPQCIAAFLVGGAICVIGQLIKDLWGIIFPALSEDQVSSVTSITLVFLGALFTGIGIYDKLGSIAGAGSIVPITGFANSIVAPAMEYKREGYIMGVGAKLFSLAGPVLVFGITASVLVGIIYFIFCGGGV